MKYIKTFEINDDRPNRFDYVLVKHLKELEIGQIISIIRGAYVIVFDNNTRGQTYHYDDHEILYWSENIEDLEAILTGNKYNL